MTGEAKTERASDGAAVVYFDGSCPLCTLEIGHYRAQAEGTGLTFVDVADPDNLPGDDLSQSDAMARFHVRRPDGTLLSGARAFVAVWETLPRWRWAARVARLPGVVPLMELGYRAFLPVRPLLSGLAERLGARAETTRPEVDPGGR